jgi:transcriptional regulator with XRE-family HTH domain
MEEPGQKLKRVRERLNLRFREVEEASAEIAQRHGNDEFIVALSRLADIENKGMIPSIYRLYSLCAIYQIDLGEVLSWYGISANNIPADSEVVKHVRTHLIGFRPEGGDVQLPIAIDVSLDLTRTAFLSRLIQVWGTLPLTLLNNIDLRSRRYGLIGTEDWSMFPLVPPGSLVVIDDSKRQIKSSRWASEFERPIYFLEHSEGYACSWCSLHEGKLILQPHPASGCDVGSYSYPGEIEVIGLVTQVASSLYSARERR